MSEKGILYQKELLRQAREALAAATEARKITEREFAEARDTEDAIVALSNEIIAQTAWVEAAREAKAALERAIWLWREEG